MSEMQEFRQMMLYDKYFNTFEFVKIPKIKCSTVRKYIGMLVDPEDRTPLVDAIWRSKGMHELEPTRETAEKFLAVMCGITAQANTEHSLMDALLSGREIEVPRNWSDEGDHTVKYDYNATVDMEYGFTTTVATSHTTSDGLCDSDEVGSGLSYAVDGAEYSSMDDNNVTDVSHFDNAPCVRDSSQSIYITMFAIFNEDDEEVFSRDVNLSFYDVDDLLVFERKLLYAYQQGVAE